MVAPYSAAMLAMVARSGAASASRPGPQNSTTAASTPCRRSAWVSVSTMSVHTTPGRRRPVMRQPTTRGTSSDTGSPSMAVAASIPPTPQPNTPRPLIIGVWLSMPTRLSGNATPSRTVTMLAKYSRFTWCTMPLLGGTTRRLSNCPIAQRTTP